MLTSRVWVLAPDSGQPQVHRDQSTCKYSCPGLQVELQGVPGPRASLTPIVSPGRSLPDPAQDPDLAAGQTPGHAVSPGPHGHRALNLHKHLAAMVSKTPPSCQLKPGQVSPARPPPSTSRHLTLLGSQSPGWHWMSVLLLPGVPPLRCFLWCLCLPSSLSTSWPGLSLAALVWGVFQTSSHRGSPQTGQLGRQGFPFAHRPLAPLPGLPSYQLELSTG